MKFDPFYLPVEQVLFAEEIGIEHVGLVEHHGVRHGGLCAANFALLSYLAGRTKRIRLGSS
jgi:alkanesulfonate monooxygenase SsuD/methylene tetrahydromethanopterin reductase-like flavin-dependent oxidoreductase (luciferase family)